MRQPTRRCIAILSLTLLMTVASAYSTCATNDSATDAAIRELVRLGAVVKRFTVRESDIDSLLVRLKAEHLDQNGVINADMLTALHALHKFALELRGLPLSDDGLKSLMANVKPLGMDVSGSQISDRGLVELRAGRTRLRMLDLSFTRVSDDGMRTVTSLSELRHLCLIECRVTDSGINRLPGLRQLREVYLAKTAVSPQAVQQLRLNLPSCRIEP